MTIKKSTLLQRTVNTVVDIYGLRAAARKLLVAASTLTRIRNGEIKSPDDITLSKLGLERIPRLEIHRKIK